MQLQMYFMKFNWSITQLTAAALILHWVSIQMAVLDYETLYKHVSTSTVLKSKQIFWFYSAVIC